MASDVQDQKYKSSIYACLKIDFNTSVIFIHTATVYRYAVLFQLLCFNSTIISLINICSLAIIMQEMKLQLKKKAFGHEGQ